MWPFGKPEARIPPACDLELVRDELATFFRAANEDAAKEGKEVVYRQEFVAGWKRFAGNPSIETATAWLNDAPDYESLLTNYFVACSPGGRFYRTPHRPKAITLKPDGRPVEQQAKQFAAEIDSVARHFPQKTRAREAFKLVLLAAAHHCLKGAEQYIRADDEKDRLNKVFLINCEFFYFFIHLANRTLYSGHGEAVGQQWQKDLGPTYVTAFLESVIGHWPKQMKERVRSELYDKMNNAEAEYASCRGLYPEDSKIFTGNTLFAALARNVAELAGTKNPAEQFLIMNHAVHVFLCLDFQNRVEAVALELK